MHALETLGQTPPQRARAWSYKLLRGVFHREPSTVQAGPLRSPATGPGALLSQEALRVSWNTTPEPLGSVLGPGAHLRSLGEGGMTPKGGHCAQ